MKYRLTALLILFLVVFMPQAQDDVDYKNDIRYEQLIEGWDFNGNLNAIISDSKLR